MKIAIERGDFGLLPFHLKRHYIVYIVVERWRGPYKLFNRMFAVATRRLELIICDRKDYDEYRRKR